MTRLQVMYDQHGPALLRYLRRLTGHSATAEDLLQETFVQALRAPDRLETVISPKAWLFTIARNLGLNALRGRRRHQALVEQIAAPEPADADQHEELLRAIAGLPPEQRETLELRLREELSYAEIADVLGIPVGTVRSRLHLAVKRLREAMTEAP